jgi:hypothetical protein
LRREEAGVGTSTGERKKRKRLDNLLRGLMAETAGDRSGKTLAKRFLEEVVVASIENEDVDLIVEILDRHDGPLDRPSLRRRGAGAGHA